MKRLVLVAVAAAAFVAPSGAVASRFGSTVTIHFTNALVVRLSTAS